MLLVVLLVVGALVALAVGRRPGSSSGRAGSPPAAADAEAEARRWYDRLGGQVLALTGTDGPSRQALSDASERYTAAGSQLATASTPAQWRLVSDTALEGLHFVRAARTAMGMDPGPALPSSAERARAGELTGERAVDLGGRTVTGSPVPSARNAHYHPGGTVAGRPVAAGWYSEPWWRPMLLGGVGAVGGVLLADALFSGFGGGVGGGFDGGWGGPGPDDGGFAGGGFGGFGAFDGGGFDGGDLFGDW
ncbi:hypothetical protein [Actinomycetospora termitidis]|uniref:DUF1542 domain-containing protein n=1 Tax=Actinomycetospora termitidis TaxID=3053470 RepID=A0ABT7M113_9PSEU|nr:hypothetical protein [Actinomycetospora sp. Odt1-22]MDL5154343.1 hypothetical protein [Actinomycetospora sp. Odt1-22]